MSAQVAETLPEQESVSALQITLIRRCALSGEAVARITTAARESGTDFVETARRLGFVSSKDIDDARHACLWNRKVTLAEQTAASPGQRLMIAHNPYDVHSERIRALRTELLLRQEGSKLANTVALVSPCAKEGRSQLSAELAVAFAQLGQPTLLVDADLRHPQQHVLFNADNKYGLSQALARVEDPFLTQVEGLPQLSLLTSGPLQPNPLELLSDQRFEVLLDDWRRHYSYVVIDTPPVSQYADGLAVATVVGRVLALSRARHTPHNATRDMLRRLSATRSRILGAVINHF